MTLSARYIPARCLQLAAILFALILAPPLALAQSSLVVNHGFEDLVSACPNAFSEVGYAKGWRFPSIGTADYFNACAPVPSLPTSPDVRVPSNSFGTQAAADAGTGGVAYAGIYAWLDGNGINYFEYVEAPLKGPLLPGVTYAVSFQVSLADNSTLAIESIGAFLGGQLPAVPNVSFLANVTPQVANGSGIITDTSGWTTISGLYTASGGETHITIGNFVGATTNSMVVTAANGSTPPGSGYYYVDSVIVVEDVPQLAGLYAVADTNELMRIDVTPPFANNICTATTVGVTQPDQGAAFRVRGLAMADDKMWGITREGFFVNVAPATGESSLIYSLVAGSPSTEFWGGLAFDGIDRFYSANTFAGTELARLELGNGIIETTIGSLLFSGSARQILGMDFYPATAPAIPPTFNGTHPAPAVLYGTNRDNDNVVVVDQASAALTMPMGSHTIGVNNVQAATFHPTTGELYIIHDHAATSNNATLSTYAFDTQTATSLCDLPFGIVETTGTGNDTYGWGGLTFAENPAAAGALSTVPVKFCVSGTSNNTGWYWEILPFADTVDPLPPNAPAEDLAEAFRKELASYGFAAYIDPSDLTCFTVLVKPGSVLGVGLASQGTVNCTVTNNPSGCTVNPTITDFSQLPPRPGTQSPFPSLVVLPALPFAGGTALLVGLLAFAGGRPLARRRPGR